MKVCFRQTFATAPFFFLPSRGQSLRGEVSAFYLWRLNMGYTHYFSRTVSLSEEQAAQLCENAAKIVTYWFDHTRNSAEIFAKKEKHSGSDDQHRYG